MFSWINRGSKTLHGKALTRTINWSAAFAFLLFGYDAGCLGGVQTTKPFLKAMNYPKNPNIIPLIASIYNVGCIFGAIFVMIFGMKMGRRCSLLLGNTLVLIGGIIQASSFSRAQIIVGRIISGLGIGVITSTANTYVAEMSIDVKARGPAGALQGGAIIWGVAVAYWVDYFFNNATPSYTNTHQYAWRLPLGMQGIFAILSAIGVFICPDTPRWYYQRGRRTEGDDVLARLYSLPKDCPTVQQARAEIVAVVDLEQKYKGQFRYLDLIWDRSVLKSGRRIRIAYLVLSFQQLMGVNMVVYFGSVIFKAIGLSAYLTSLLSAVLNTVYALASMLTIYTVEPIGRRKLMFWGAIANGICLIWFTSLTAIPDSKKSLGTQWAAVAALFVYIISFGWCWIAVPWLYGPEIAPLQYRHIAGAAGALGEWTWTFVTVFGGGVAINKVGGKIWIWQLCFCVISTVFVYFQCPETSGRSLEQIDELFAPEAQREVFHNSDSSNADVRENEKGGTEKAEAV